MKQLIKIKQRLFSPQGQKISLTFVLISFLFFSPTFAQSVETTTQTSEILKNTQYFIGEVIKFLSRSWILLATLAGKFMTNDMVYGSWLHLDSYLWKMRNICKNFANFGLLGILLRQIFQYISNKTGNLQKIVTTSVIAGIGIQASWFIMAVLLDISTIATAAVASFPTHFIDNNAFSKQTISDEIAKNMKAHTLRFDKRMNPTLETDPNTTATSVEEFIEKIMPKNDSVSGPLIYIGASTLRIQNALNQKPEQDITGGKIIITLALQFLAIAIYCITLILLLITNIIRVGLLWVIIPISPILVLMFALGKDGGKDGIAKNFNIPVILNAIFKPVIFTGVLSLILIFIVSMQNIMTSGNNSSFSIQGTTFSSEGNLATMDVNGISKTTINDTVFTELGNTGKNIFSNIIIYFATIFLLRYLVKIAASSGGGTIGDTMTKATGLVENMASTAPIIGGYSAKAYMESSNIAMQNMGKAAGVDLNYGSSNFGKRDVPEEYKKWLKDKLGDDQWDSRDFSDLETARDFNYFINKTNNVLRQAPLSYKESPETFAKRETFFNKVLVKDKTSEFNKESNKYFNDTKTLSLENLSEKGFKELHSMLGGSANKVPKDYKEFKETSYGKID